MASSSETYNNAFDTREGFTATYRLRRFDGEFRWVVDHASPFLRGGLFAGYFGSVTDITEERAAHDALVNALNQRDILLGEIYHRVKNNLQQIEGLIALESARIADADAQRAMQSISNRVRAMAAVHSSLVKATSLKQITTDAFLSDLTANLARAHGAERKGIRIEAKVERAVISIDRAMTLGLIVNELVINAIKHAFPDNQKGRVLVRYGASPAVGNLLEVIDNGVGLEGGELDRAPLDGSGMRLVHGFVEQLNGRLSMASDGGAIFRVELPQQACVSGSSNLRSRSESAWNRKS